MSGLSKVNLSLIYFVHNPIPNNTGNVHNANDHNIKAHCIGSHDCSANNCILCVNQHGNKNVNAHTIGEYFGFFNVKIHLLIRHGKWNHNLEILGKNQRSCNPRYSRTNQTTKLRIVLIHIVH